MLLLLGSLSPSEELSSRSALSPLPASPWIAQPATVVATDDERVE